MRVVDLMPGAGVVAGILQDLRHALRVYATTPLATAVAVGALAAALASLAATFSLFSDLVLKPPAGFAPRASVATLGQSNSHHLGALSLTAIERIAHDDPLLTGLAGVFGPMPLALADERGRITTRVELVTQEYFPALRPRVLLGRGLTPEDHQAGSTPVAVLSYGFWLSRYAGRRAVLGESIALSGRPATAMIGRNGVLEPPKEQTGRYRIVGVLAPEVRGTFGSPVDLWVPYELAGPLFVGAGPIYRDASSLAVIGRLAPGVSAATLRADLMRRYAPGDHALGLMPGSRLDALGGIVRSIDVQRAVRSQVRLLLAGSLLLALVTASNIALFLISRGPSRRRELAIRMACGATLERLARQLVTETALIVVAAAITGVLLSLWLAAFLQHLALLRNAEWHAVTPLEWRVLAMALGAVLLLTALVSLGPVLGARRAAIAATSRLTGARPGPLQLAAETVQIIVASVLASAAIAFLWYLAILNHTPLGFEPQGVYVIAMKPPKRAVSLYTPVQQVAAERDHRRRVIGGLPGVEGVAFGSAVPGRVTPFVALFPRPGSRATDVVSATMLSSDPELPAVLGMRLLYGRGLPPGDPNAVLVNETLARQLWGRSNVVGEVFGRSHLRIVGVLRDAVFGHPSEAVEPMIFRLFTPLSFNDLIVVRTSGTLRELRRALRQKIDEGALRLDIDSVRPLSEIWRSELAPDRARMLLSTGSAILVVLLAALGFYGTQRYLVEAGRREYAIRSAVGAGPRSIRRLVLTRAVLLALPGSIAGAALSYSLVAWLHADFLAREVAPGLVTAATLLTIAAITLGASFGPALLAARSPPARHLREN
ncbi:MAG: FtsX-like permease family protein [Steroidobacteraceae bacterium]